MDWSQQVQVYVSWVNSQLRKLQRQPLIRQLQDPAMKDGTVLGLLVEIISGIRVPGIAANPASGEQRLANINALLAFMQAHKVKMHAIEAEAVVEGDLKSIMRIVLALAAHFKPRSVRPNTVAAIMQGAAVSLANTKHQVLRSPSIAEKRFDFGVRTPTGESRARLPSCRDVELEEEEEERSAFPTGIPLAPRGPYARRSPSLAGSPAATEADSGCHVTPSSLPTRPGRPEDSEELLQEVGEARALLEQLQQLLLSAPPADKGFANDSFGDLRLQSPDAEQRIRDLEEQLRSKEERLFANELQLRRTSLHAEASTEEAVQLRLQLSEKEALMAAQQQQIDRLQRHVADVTSDLEASVVERCRMSREFAHMSDERQRSSKDLTGLVTSANFAEQQRASVFDECMERLRSSMAANDPQHHLLDQMEHCFHYQHQAALGTVPPPLPPRSIAARRAASRPSSLELERPKDLKRQPITALQGFPIQRLDQPLEDDERTTRLLYFTEKTITPFVVTIPKRADAVTLADVRRASGHMDRASGPRFRFLFKTHEPEFGAAVKEEVRQDASAVPTWEDKVVVWILEASEQPS